MTMTIGDECGSRYPVRVAGTLVPQYHRGRAQIRVHRSRCVCACVCARNFVTDAWTVCMCRHVRHQVSKEERLRKRLPRIHQQGCPIAVNRVINFSRNRKIKFLSFFNLHVFSIVVQVIKGYQKFSSTPKYMVYN